MVGAVGAGIIVRTVPPIFTAKELKSFMDGLTPKAAPVMVESAAVPVEAPLSSWMTVEVDKVGDATVLPEAEVKTKSVPF